MQQCGREGSEMEETCRPWYIYIYTRRAIRHWLGGDVLCVYICCGYIRERFTLANCPRCVRARARVSEVEGLGSCGGREWRVRAHLRPSFFLSSSSSSSSSCRRRFHSYIYILIRIYRHIYTISHVRCSRFLPFEGLLLLLLFSLYPTI